jgi:alpha-methylacyl-CoA racemase
MLDGGAPFYDTYETADGKYIAVGALEMRFWADLVKVLGLDPEQLPVHLDQSEWPRLREIITEAIGKRTQAELVARAEGTDACLTPVLSPWEAAQHPHNKARGTFVEIGGLVQPAPAPRFDRTPADTPEGPHETGSDTDEVLGEYGLDATEIGRLRAAGVVA